MASSPADTGPSRAAPVRRSPARRRRELPHDRRIQVTAMLGGLPAILIALAMMWREQYSSKTVLTLGFIMIGAWLLFAGLVRDRVTSPLRTLANLLEALREGDYSMRARAPRVRSPGEDDALREVLEQVNAMSATLRAQRLGAMEATTLLRKVMEEIAVAVFAFDSRERLKLVNRAGERLLAQPADRLLNRRADDLGLKEFLDTNASTPLERSFPGGAGRWGIAHAEFREGGLPHRLLVLTDLTRALREEELQAWQRLVRVLGHELNNSLTPIKSIAGSLETLVMQRPLPADWEADMRHGLSIISTRSEALSRFLSAYAKLARLPRPTLQPMDVGEWVRHGVKLELRMPVEVREGPPTTVRADRDQLDHLLINVLRNAVDAALETGGGVSLGWERTASQLQVWVRDEGPGLSNTANLFVPFFTTKPGGSGIGLVLARQIAEAHGGSFTLENRKDRTGCEARLVLPA